MFLVTRRTRTTLNDVGFVKTVFLVTSLAFAIDRFDGDAVAKTIAQHVSKFSGDGIAVVTLGAVVGELRVTRRDFAGIKKSFAAGFLNNPDGEQATEDGQ